MTNRSISTVQDIINELPTIEEYNSSVEIIEEHGSIDENNKIFIVKMNDIIYASKHISCPTIRRQKEILFEYELISNLKLMGYHRIYFDINNKIMIILQDYLKCNLLEYISYNNNKSNLKYPTLNELETKKIILPILYKLKKLHKSGYIHCNIKPSNILSKDHDNNTTSCNWYLINYGLLLKYNLNRGYTYNTWRGTIGWTSPELIPHNNGNNRITPLTDVWSLGLCILYMIIGENPFELTINDCKLNKLFTLELAKKYWFKNKLLIYNQNKKFNHYLIFLHKKNKISLNLLDLLLNHMLVFNVNKRSNIKQILKHKWLKSVVKSKKRNSISLKKRNSISLNKRGSISLKKNNHRRGNTVNINKQTSLSLAK